MEVWPKISGSSIRRVIEVLFFSAMFALPWINQIRAATFMLLFTGGFLILTGNAVTNYSSYKKQLLFWLFGGYYLLHVILLFIYPGNAAIHDDIERKVSFLAIPLLLYIITDKYKDVWHKGITGFIYGNVFAALYCLAGALVRISSTKNTREFFYHQYAHPIGLSAIYFSFYLLIALGYIILDRSYLESRRFSALITVFLYLNVLLLSSKIMIVAGTMLLFIPVLKTITATMQKIGVACVIICICGIIAGTGNPIKKRFTDVDLHNYSTVLKDNNFSNYTFDGLSLRLLLWRLGNELIREKRAWIFGAGGIQYHLPLNEKIKRYQLYSGNKNFGDTGYQNYNMHNQYMESYVQFGLAGVLLLIAMLGAAIYYALHTESPVMLYAAVLFSVAFLTESVLETQSGILLFTIIISGEWIQSQKKKTVTLH